MKCHYSHIVISAFLLALAPLTWAHDTNKRQHDATRKIDPDIQVFGRAGDAKKVSRTIDIELSDTMRFTPALITVRQGETVRFNIRNAGQVMHEMVLGTLAGLKEHATLMRRFPGMEHDEPHMAHVKPGATGHLVWQFTSPGTFYYGCLVAGHFEAGMMGRLIVN